MRSTPSSSLLKFLALLLFSLSFVSLLLVSERVIAAFWEWYKFHGYETSGVITLSATTGVAFLVASMLLISTSLAVRKLSGNQKVEVGIKFSGYAAIVSGLSFVLYLAIALSPLNMWRP